MVNSLVITNSFDFVQKFLKEANLRKLNIKLPFIARNEKEAMSILKENQINIIFLDNAIKFDFSKIFFKTYQDIIVFLAYLDTRHLITPKKLQIATTIIRAVDSEITKRKIRKELQFIGYKFNYRGTQYLVDTILEMYLGQDELIDNLQRNIYPIIAKKYNKTVVNVKCSINKATETMYCECDSDKLKKYFCFYDDAKPTIKQVIFAVMNRLYA